MTNFSEVIIRFSEKRNTSTNTRRKPKTILIQDSMQINLSLIDEYSKNIIEVAKDPYKIEASINIWRQLYSKQILKFIDEKKYSSNFSRVKYIYLIIFFKNFRWFKYYISIFLNFTIII